MLSLFQFEKLISIDRDKEIIEKRNAILPMIHTTTSKQFFNTYRNKNMLLIISSYLSDSEKINFLYLNNFTFTNLKMMLSESSYKILKGNLMKLYKSGETFHGLIRNNASILLSSLSFYPENYKTPEEFYTAANLIGKWMNNLYFETNYNLSNGYKVSFLTTKRDDLNEYGTLFLLLTIAHNSSLEAIDLSDSNLSALKYFKFAFRKEKKVYSLNLEGNLSAIIRLEYFVNSFEYLNKHLKYLNLSKICLERKDAEYLSNYLNKLIFLEIFICDDNSINSLGAKDLLYSLSKLNFLKKLSFRNTDIDEKFAGALGSFLCSKSIESIDLGLNKFLNNGFAARFSSFLATAKITNIDFDSCSLKESDLEYILTAFGKNEKEMYLNINNNDSSEGIRRKIMDIVNNHISNKKIMYEGRRYAKEN